MKHAFEHFINGVRLFRDKRYLEASREIEKAIEINANEISYYGLLAECYYELKQYDHTASLILNLNLSPVIQIENKISQEQVIENSFDDMAQTLIDIISGLKEQSTRIDIIDDIELELQKSHLERDKLGILSKVKAFLEYGKSIDNGIGKSVSLIRDGSNLITSLTSHYNSLATLFSLPLI